MGRRCWQWGGSLGSGEEGGKLPHTDSSHRNVHGFDESAG